MSQPVVACDGLVHIYRTAKIEAVVFHVRGPVVGDDPWAQARALLQILQPCDDAGHVDAGDLPASAPTCFGDFPTTSLLSEPPGNTVSRSLWIVVLSSVNQTLPS